jgi:AbiV family abortive infection protein
MNDQPNSKELYNISRNECLKLYGLVLKNADDNWIAGTLLADKEYYGQAISLITISIEETIKGAIILLDGSGFDFRTTKGVKRVFKEHGIRYYTAYLLMVIYLFGEDLKKLIDQVLQQPDKLEQFRQMANDSVELQEMAIKFFKQKLIEISQELSFFKEMDESRQKGFYSDYKKIFHTPAMITKIDFQNTHIRLSKVKELAQIFIDALLSYDVDIIESKENILRILKEEKVYRKLARCLEGTKTKELFRQIEETIISLDATDWLQYKL